MTANEYFGSWMKVIDKDSLTMIMKWIQSLDPSIVCPSLKNIFKAFKLCSYEDCIQIWLGMDPFPQKGVATGILFGNSRETPEYQLSPSLQIIKEAMIDYTIPHNRIEFDNTMESLAKQGILLINSALTCEVNKIGSHTTIWRNFISKFLRNFSYNNPGTVFILFGNQACSFKKDIVGMQHILECYHPAYYARNGSRMPSDVFIRAKDLSKAINGINIKYFNETEYGSC